MHVLRTHFCSASTVYLRVRLHTPAFSSCQPSLAHAAPQELAAKPDVEYIAGGAGQNSIRVAQWMLQVR